MGFLFSRTFVSEKDIILLTDAMKSDRMVLRAWEIGGIGYGREKT